MWWVTMPMSLAPVAVARGVGTAARRGRERVAAARRFDAGRDVRRAGFPAARRAVARWVRAGVLRRVVLRLLALRCLRAMSFLRNGCDQDAPARGPAQG